MQASPACTLATESWRQSTKRNWPTRATRALQVGQLGLVRVIRVVLHAIILLAFGRDEAMHAQCDWASWTRVTCALKAPRRSRR